MFYRGPSPFEMFRCNFLYKEICNYKISKVTISIFLMTITFQNAFSQWFTIIYYHMFPRKIVRTQGKSWSKYLNKETCSTLLESIFTFTFCFHKILWSSKCTPNMFILNFLDFLEVEVCLQEFFTDRKLFKSSFLDVSNDFAISCLQLSYNMIHIEI